MADAANSESTLTGRRKVAHELLGSWTGQNTNLNISLGGDSLGVDVPSMKTILPWGRRKIVHLMSGSCTSTVRQLHKMRDLVGTQKNSSKHTHAGSSYEEHVTRVPMVKTDLNSDTRFERYGFLKF